MGQGQGPAGGDPSTASGLGPAYLEPLPAGRTDTVITALATNGKDPTCTVTQSQAIAGRDVFGKLI